MGENANAVIYSSNPVQVPDLDRSFRKAAIGYLEAWACHKEEQDRHLAVALRNIQAVWPMTETHIVPR